LLGIGAVAKVVAVSDKALDCGCSGDSHTLHSLVKLALRSVIRILNEHDTLDQIPEGTILVTPSTDPAMLAFFPLAAGLIVEVGGMLSHGSIIAREYGLPAVSNITDARKRLKSGDRVLLDGTTGVVQILEPAEARQPAQEASLSKSIKR
jgi:phosphoenolpyruvate synthase/pyruvate phosphate dikinase